MTPITLDIADISCTSSPLYREERQMISEQKRERNISVKKFGGFQEISLFFQSTENEKDFARPSSRKGLSESFSFPSRNSAMLQALNTLNEVFLDLNFTNKKVLDVAHDIIKDFLSKGQSDLNVSKTGDGEILLFTAYNDSYNNIIIDNDCDIEFMHIASNRAESYNEYFDFEENFDTFSLAAKL